MSSPTQAILKALEPKSDLTPPEGVQAACRQGLKIAPEYGGSGLTPGAKARATSMSQGKSISEQQVRRMHAYFSRHAGDRKSDWASPPTPGYVAWQLWGGDAGKSWAASQSEKLEKSARREALAKSATGARQAVMRAEERQSGYHKAFAEAAKAILPQGVIDTLHKRARAIAGGQGKASAAAAARADAHKMGELLEKAEWSESDHPRDDGGKFSDGGGASTGGDGAANHEATADHHYGLAYDAKQRGDMDEHARQTALAREAMGRHVKELVSGKTSPKGKGEGAKKGPPSPAKEKKQPERAAAETKPAAEKTKDDSEKDAAKEHSFYRQSQEQHLSEGKKAQAKADAYRAAGKSGLAAKHQAVADAHASEVRAIAADRTEVSSQRAGQLLDSARSASVQGGAAGLTNFLKNLSPLERATVVAGNRRVKRIERTEGQKPMGAAFAHARASGKKQDHKSRKRRANAYLQSQGHAPIGKSAPCVEDVRQEQFVDAEPKKKRKKDRVPVEMATRIVKAEDVGWKKLVWSVVYEPDVVDSHGDYMTAETIEKAAHGAMRNGIYINREHAGSPIGAHVVESYVAPCNMVFDQGGEQVTVAKGSWVMGMQIESDAVWGEVLDGTFTGFSLEGSAAVPQVA